MLGETVKPPPRAGSLRSVLASLPRGSGTEPCGQAHHACQRGHTVSIPFCDNAGYDAIVDGRKGLSRVQVRGTSVFQTYRDVLATLYYNLGIDSSAATVTDFSGRPRYLLDDAAPIRELVG
jgi:hypothetical protein